MFYLKGRNEELIGYTDNYYASDQDDKKSMPGFVFMLNSGVVSWFSKKDHVVTLFTTEVEFIVAGSSAYQAVWLRRVLKELNRE